ncbi:MAG: hypothetical protein IJH71_02730, partial [Eubacterium sp.]|nr:hypothetical protein [Eubacterium sp.]
MYYNTNIEKNLLPLTVFCEKIIVPAQFPGQLFAIADEDGSFYIKNPGSVKEPGSTMPRTGIEPVTRGFS